MEHVTLTKAMGVFCSNAFQAAQEKKAPKDIQTLFETGLYLLEPDSVHNASSETKNEIKKIISANQEGVSLFSKKINYSSFFIRGKYERDTLMQGYFRAIQWFQAFSFDSDSGTRCHIYWRFAEHTQ